MVELFEILPREERHKERYKEAVRDFERSRQIVEGDERY